MLCCFPEYHCRSRKYGGNVNFNVQSLFLGPVVTKVSNLCGAVHRQDLDLLVSAGGGRGKGGAGAEGHLHLITATSASHRWP